jgi:hypothetical protein
MKQLTKTLLRSTLMLLAGVMLISGLALAGSNNKGNNITSVNCTGNPTDRALIQSAVNNAASGDVLMLVGTCQLDGTRVFITKSNLTITGAGKAGNWSTVVQGIASAGGTPEGDQGSTFFNRGFQIGDDSGNSQVKNVDISNIKFSTLHRGIIVDPQVGQTTTQCSGATVGTGSASSIVVENNWFDNDDRSAQIFGTGNNVVFQNNLVTNATSGNFDFVMEGELIACAGSPGFLSPIGIPTNSAIAGNSISGANELVPILVFGADKISITDNIFSGVGVPFMIFLSEDSNSQVSNNEIDGGGSAIGVFVSDFQSAVAGFPPNSSNVRISNNIFKNELLGVGIDSGTTGYSVINNRFVSSSIADIVLCGTVANTVCSGGTPPSFQNKVVTTNFGNSVIDNGTNNQLLGTQNLINNSSVPAGVKNKLIDGAAGRPQL